VPTHGSDVEPGVPFLLELVQQSRRSSIAAPRNRFSGCRVLVRDKWTPSRSSVEQRGVATPLFFFDKRGRSPSTMRPSPCVLRHRIRGGHSSPSASRASDRHRRPPSDRASSPVSSERGFSGCKSAIGQDKQYVRNKPHSTGAPSVTRPWQVDAEQRPGGRAAAPAWLSSSYCRNHKGWHGPRRQQYRQRSVRVATDTNSQAAFTAHTIDCPWPRRTLSRT